MNKFKNLYLEYQYIRELLEDAQVSVQSMLNEIEIYLNDSSIQKGRKSNEMESNLFYLDSINFNLKILLSMLDEIEYQYVIDTQKGVGGNDQDNVLFFDYKEKEKEAFVDSDCDISYLFNTDDV